MLPRRAPPASSSGGGVRKTASSPRIFRRRSRTSSPACTRCSERCGQELPEEHRGDAVSSMVYEANARMRDPVYGCVGAISYLQQQVDGLQQQLALTQAEMLHLRVRQATSASHTNSGSHLSCTLLSHSNFDMDMLVDQPSFRESMWSST